MIKIFYKRGNNQAWKGPATVLGEDGPVVFILQGSHYIKTHTCCVQPSNPDRFIQTETINPDQYTKRKAENSNYSINSNLNHVRSTTENEDISDDRILPSQRNEEQSQHSEILPSPQYEEHSQHSENTENLNQNLKLKTNVVMDFMNDNNEHGIVRIIGPAGKSTGKYKTCTNIEYEAPEALAGTKTWIDILTLLNLTVNQPIPPNEQSELNTENNSLPMEEIFQPQSIGFVSAKEMELQSWTENKVYETVTYKDQQCISIRWYVQ